MSADDSNAAIFQDQPITQLLVKVAARCNIDCSYCYWFRDAAVYDKPKLMSDRRAAAVVAAHRGACRQTLSRRFSHRSARRRAACCGASRTSTVLPRPARPYHRRTGCEIPIAVTTNGVLIDDEWLDCFETRNISVAISMDGPAHIHDLHRQHVSRHRHPRRGGTRRSHAGIARHRRQCALAVCNPAYPPAQYVEFFAACGIANYDIMIPDATVDEKPAIHRLVLQRPVRLVAGRQIAARRQPMSGSFPT